MGFAVSGPVMLVNIIANRFFGEGIQIAETESISLIREESDSLVQTNQESNISLSAVNIKDIDIEKYLMLVNRQHPVSLNLFSNFVPVWPTVPASTSRGIYLHPAALTAVEEMFNSAKNAVVGTFFISSGYRNFDEQVILYDNGANSAFALPPGHSEHHTGLAVDIMAVGIGMWELGNSPEGRWLANNSYRYGLILRYLQGAEHITGIEFEPWHFRYVGKIHAYYIHRHNLVLEEYIKLIQNQGGISFEKNSIIYHVLHQLPQNDIIYVPDELDFTVSADNLGGYIITTWER